VRLVFFGRRGFTTECTELTEPERTEKIMQSKSRNPSPKAFPASSEPSVHSVVNPIPQSQSQNQEPPALPPSAVGWVKAPHATNCVTQDNRGGAMQPQHPRFPRHWTHANPSTNTRCAAHTPHAGELCRQKCASRIRRSRHNSNAELPGTVPLCAVLGANWDCPPPAGSLEAGSSITGSATWTNQLGAGHLAVLAVCSSRATAGNTD
jgi:hypothetical protein